MIPGKKDTHGDHGAAATPSTIVTTCEYYLMTQSSSESSVIPIYNKLVLPLDSRLQFQTNSAVDTLDEHQVAAIRKVINERNARTVDTGEWLLSALSVAEGSFKFLISFRHYDLSPDSRGTYPATEVVEGTGKEADSGQRDPEEDSVEVENPTPEPVPETPGTENGQQQPVTNPPPNPDSEDSDLASTVGPRSATPGSELDSRSSTPVPRKTCSRKEIQIDRLDGIEDLLCEALEYLRDEDPTHQDYREAIDVLSRVLDTRIRLMGEWHPKTLMTAVHLAYNGHKVPHYAYCDMVVSTMIGRKANYALQKVIGEKHPETLMTLHFLARGYQINGSYETAVRIFGLVLKGRAEVLGKTHEKTLVTMNRLAQVCNELGWQKCPKEAVESLLECQKEACGKAHKITLDTMEHLANVYLRDNLLDKADVCMTSLLEHRKESCDIRNPSVVKCMYSLADIRLKRFEL